MMTVVAVLMCAALFALAAFLREPRRCGSHCSGCALGACEREPKRTTEGAPRRTTRGTLTLEIDDE